MQTARLLLTNRHLAALLCVATLLLKLLVPTGYMIGNAHDRITIELCSGMQSRPMAMHVPGKHAGMPDHGDNEHGKESNGGAEIPCQFSGLSAPSLGAVDPVPLAAPAFFFLALDFCPTAPPSTCRRSYLRPPLRGPPVLL